MVPVSCAPLPAVSASMAPLERPVPLPSLHTQPLWTAPLNPGMLYPVLSSGHQQLTPTASQSPAQVPTTIQGKVQHSQYIDLSELLAYSFQYKYSGLDDSQALEIVDGKLSLDPKCKARHLSALQLWLRAWHLYEDTVLSFYPSRYQELSHYWCHIADLDQCFHWAAVLSYDAQFQHRCAIQGLPFSAFDQQLYVTTLDAMATKVSACRCFWCQHFDHKVVNCPFPLGAPLEKDLALKKAAQGQLGLWNQQRHLQQHSLSRGSSPQLPPVLYQGREICIKYQSHSCTFPTCRKAHVCRNCKQEHPASECCPAGAVASQPQ